MMSDLLLDAMIGVVVVVFWTECLWWSSRMSGCGGGGADGCPGS